MVERALAVTIDYVKERKAFGKPVPRIPEHAVQACRTEDPEATQIRAADLNLRNKWMVLDPAGAR